MAAPLCPLRSRPRWLAIVFLALPSLNSGLLRPGGCRTLGAILLYGVIDACRAAVLAPWDREEAKWNAFGSGEAVREGEGMWRATAAPPLTPGRRPLIFREPLLRRLPSVTRAGDKFEPRDIPCRAGQPAVDRVAPDRAALQPLWANIQADLPATARGPISLVAQQAELWTRCSPGPAPLRRDFATTTGPPIAHRWPRSRLAHDSPPDAFGWPGVALVTIGGSLIAALAVLEGALTPDQAWQAVSVDERWQLEKWGADAEAEAAMDSRRRDFLAAAQFLELLG